MENYELLREPLALIIFLLTLFLPIIIGFFTLKLTKNASDFYLGGRKVSRFAVSLSAVSSGRSSWLILGVSGMAYKMGVSAVWAVVGYILVEMFQFIFIGRKLRDFSQKENCFTLLDFFEKKLNDKNRIVRIVGAVILVIFMLSYVAAQLNAGAKALSSAMNISFFGALIFSAVIILVYMLMGGFLAVVYNDVIRAFIMIFGLVILPVVAIIKIGGISILLNILAQLNIALVNPFSLGIGALIGFLGIGLGSPGQPHIVVRYMSIDDSRNLVYSSFIGTVWNVIMAWGAIFIGLAARVIIDGLDKTTISNPEMVYLFLSSKYFGPVLFGILAGGVFAAILSTADSQLLVVSTTLVRDIFQQIFNIFRDEKKILFINRVILFISGAIAVFFAYYAKDIIFWLVLFAWGGLGASFGPALIFSLYWNNTNKYGIIAGMLSGTFTTIIWKLYLKPITGIYELIPAFVIACLFIVVFSRLFSEKETNNG